MRLLALSVVTLSGADFCSANSGILSPLVQATGGNETSPVTVLRSSPTTLYDILPGRLDQPLPTTSSPLLAANVDEFAFDDRDRVNVTRATLYSFLLPGAGQWYAGARGRAGVFLASEGLAWAAFGYFETVGAIKRKDYQAYARVHAGIDPTDKDDEFYRLITFYDSREEYNTAGRIIRPWRPYYPDSAFYDWQWSSPQAMGRYRALRNQSNEAFNRGKFVLGALLLNRLVSAVDAWRTAKLVNRRARMELAGWKVGVKGTPLGGNPRLFLTLKKRF